MIKATLVADHIRSTGSKKDFKSGAANDEEDKKEICSKRNSV